jgi:hypothetical protein
LDGIIFTKKIFSKPLDNRRKICYNHIIKGREDTEMANWYENPEIHADDYEELMALLAEEATAED